MSSGTNELKRESIKRSSGRSTCEGQLCWCETSVVALDLFGDVLVGGEDTGAFVVDDPIWIPWVGKIKEPGVT